MLMLIAVTMISVHFHSASDYEYLSFLPCSQNLLFNINKQASLPLPLKKEKNVWKVINGKDRKESGIVCGVKNE